MPAGYEVQAIVLGNRSLGEGDRLAILLTRDQGKLRVSVRGGRRTTSKLAGLVRPFDRVQLDLYRGRSLDGVRSGAVLESFNRLRSDFDAMSYAFCMAEIGDHLAQEGESDHPLYLLTLTCFRALHRGMDPLLWFAFFCVRAVKVAGFYPILDECVHCGGGPGGTAMVDFASGGAICGACWGQGGSGRRSVDRRVRDVIRDLHDTHPRSVGALGATESDLRWITGLFLDYLEYQMDRRVNSRSFLDILG